MRRHWGNWKRHRPLSFYHPHQSVCLRFLQVLGGIHRALWEGIPRRPRTKFPILNRRKEHPDTLTSSTNLVVMLQDQSKYEEAEQMHRQALQGYEKALGKEHPDTLRSINNLAVMLQYQGKYEEAEQMNPQALQGYE